MTVTHAEIGFRPELLVGLADGVEVRFQPNMPPATQRLMATLGVRVVFDTEAPAACAHADVATPGSGA